MDQHQFRELYEEYATMVFTLALHYLQNTSDAEEVAQDVFIKIHDKYSAFENRSSVKTWIYRLTINQSLDYIRKTKAKKRSGNIISISEPSYDLPEAGHMDHPGIQLEQKEKIELIIQHINALPEMQKTALILKSIEGLSQSEIAAIMKKDEKAVESLLSRARKTLKEKLQQNEG